MNKGFHHNSLNSQKGFSLVEIILYLGMFSIILLLASTLFTSMLEARVKHRTMTEVNEVGVAVMQVITQSLRNAESITGPTIGTNGGTLTLDVVTGADDPTVVDLVSEVIRIKEGAATAVPLVPGFITASGLTFTNLSQTGTPGTIRVQFTLTRSNPSAINAYDYSKTFYGTGTLRQP